MDIGGTAKSITRTNKGQFLVMIAVSKSLGAEFRIIETWP